MDIGGIVERIKRCMELEDRKDVEFRALIALTELGDIVKYITHDPVLNPKARTHGTRTDEELAYGQALVQTIATMLLRKIDVVVALEAGLKNWEDTDWRRRQNLSAEKVNMVKGKTVCHGRIAGTAYIASESCPLDAVPQDCILVVQFATPAIAGIAKRVRAIVTDQGGITCHAAVIAREFGIPCIVGTGNATKIIPSGVQVLVDADKDDGIVEIVSVGAKR